VLAVAVWEASWLELLIGLVLLPALATLIMSLRHRSGHFVTLTQIAVLAILVPEAAALFYGSMALVTALHGNGGCEITAVSNCLRGARRPDRLPDVRPVRRARRAPVSTQS
jgi:hypothetical protein